MPSRKRSQGKARKAKAAKADGTTNSVQQRQRHDIIGMEHHLLCCNHGRAELPRHHVCSRLFGSFCYIWRDMLRPRSFCAYSSLDAMLELYEGQSGNFFRSESNRELFRGYCCRMQQVFYWRGKEVTMVVGRNFYQRGALPRPLWALKIMVALHETEIRKK